ncbi:MAG: hypothetical protein QOJ70_1251 [Acidobacteriota bacterium]|jgi:site-specific DNA-methyltransferase (adenine-specific)/adenine-specific DNA-methyltransferase|nr:hypothetical protein [Acidobacteriota bacterium]
MPTARKFNLSSDEEIVSAYEFEPIQGYPMLNWKGKQPFRSTQYYPAQIKELHGVETNGWRNKLYWGDNLQVISHLLKHFRGKVKLIYIDPPFDSGIDYRKTIKLRGRQVTNDQSVFEEKQYTDIWINDDYLQFMYERLILMRELLSDEGSIFIHCDWHKSHYIRMILEEVFGSENFLNEIIWKRKQATSYASKKLGIANDTIFWAAKTQQFTFNPEYSLEDENTRKYIAERYRYKTADGRIYKLGDLGNPEYRPNLIYEYKGYPPPANGWAVSLERMKQMDAEGRLEFPKDKGGRMMRRQFLDEYKGQLVQNLWLDIPIVNSQAKERLDYPTQKPEALLERIIKMSSAENDLVLDCFLGSGTTMAAAIKLARRCIGADINLGAVQITTKRLIRLAEELAPRQGLLSEDDTKYSGLEVYNVNHYDVFRNPVQAKELLIEAFEIQPLVSASAAVYDGEKDGRMVKVMPINRIATRADLNELIAGFDYRTFERRYAESPNRPVERLLLVCMGHEPDLAAHLKTELHPFKIDVEVLDILKNESRLEFKRSSEALLAVKKGNLVIERFYPMNLLQKLSLMKEDLRDWRELVESVLVDWNYDGAVLTPSVVDVPGEDDMVSGSYPIPKEAGTVRVKITDLLSESWEGEIQHG